MIATIAVIAVAVSAYLFAPGVTGSGAAAAIGAIPGSHALAVLEADRQQMIAMSAAANTLTVVTKPKLASPGQITAANPNSAATAASGSGTSIVPMAPPDPRTAESIAYNMLASFGFSPSAYYGCLYLLWQRESGWVYDAENASGAYGIPQALPASKMATAGSDYLTNPATQIRWGLGYIKGQYGTPCSAWAFEEANNYY